MYDSNITAYSRHLILIYCYYFTYDLTYQDAMDLCGELSKNGRMKKTGTDFISKATLDTVLLGQ